MEKVLNKNGVDYLIGKIKNYVNINVNRLQDEIDVVFDITNKFIDLGLPSGTLWAECNFGADKPYEYGKYAAFGEHKAYVFGEHSFDISSYTGSGIDADLTKDDDCINITMGGEYLIPSKEQFTELVQNTTREEISDYEGTGVKGILLTSNINGNKIFFPLPGYSTYKTRSYNEQYGYYVTTQYYNENQIKAVRLGGTSVNLNNDLLRITGISIRPVVNKEYYSLRIKDASSVLYENNTLDANNVKNALDKIVATQSLTSENIDNINKTIEEIELFKFPNVTIIGEPTIQSGQISNFSKTNYLQFPFILDLRDKSFEIDFCFTTNTNVTTQQNILDSKFGIALAIKDGKGLMAISSNGTSWDIGSSVGSFDIQPNTTYYAKLIWDKSRYVTKLSVDGTEYVEDMVLTSSIRPYPTTIFIGGCDTEETSHDTHPFFGTINMNKAILSVSGNIIWQGMDDAGLATRLAIDFSNIDEEGKTKVKEITNDKIYLTLFLLVDENTNEIKSKEIHDKDGNVMSYDDIKSLLDTHKVYIIYNLENRDNILQLVVNDDNQISFARTYGEESYVDTCFVDIYKDGGIENGIYTLMGEEQYHYFDDAIKKNTVLYLVYNTTENTLKDAKGKSVTFQDIYNKITTDGTTVKVYVDEMYEGALMSVSYVEESDIWFNQFDMDTQSNKVTNYYLILNDDDTYEFGQYGLAGKLVDLSKRNEVFNDTKNNIAKGSYSHAEGSGGIIKKSININIFPESERELAFEKCGVTPLYYIASDTDTDFQTGVYDLYTDSARTALYCKAISYGRFKFTINVNGTDKEYDIIIVNPLDKTMTAPRTYYYTKECGAIGDYSHTENRNNIAYSDNTHSEGYINLSYGTTSHSEGYHSSAIGDGSHAEGWECTALGNQAHAEGYSTKAISNQAHAEGCETVAVNERSHAEGYKSIASGYASHAEGYTTTASGVNAHSEGNVTTASGSQSHAEGNNTTASGDYSHSGGYDSVASGKASFAHGFGCYAKTNACTALGWSTIANRHQQVVIGQNNIEDTTDYMFIIGNGADNDYRHNALAVKDDGTIVTWINDEKIELSPSKIKELVEMENQFVVISSALNDLNERLNALSTTVTMNQTLQPIVYGANISSYDAGGAQTMDLDDEDYDGLVDMQSLDLDDDAESDIAPMSDGEETED